jgi:MscS family membrane protein
MAADSAATGLLQSEATASPRDTLRSFLATVDVVAEQKRLGDFDESEYHLLRQAIAMLDFSATPDGDDWAVRMLRVALLHEVLGRTELPAAADIPNAQAVAADDITEWGLPGTRIRLERVMTGPRAGEFLFAADTVAVLDRLYRRAKAQPYRADATPGVYEQVVSLTDTDGVYERLIRVHQRLEPVDTTSPRTTLDGFLANLNQAYALVMEADAALAASPPTMSKAEARALERKASGLLHRAVDAVDLRRVPAALREEVGEVAALMLKEVLDRMILPPLDAVPNEQAVAAARDGVLGSFLRSDGPLRWRLPNTEIEIVEINDGDRQGEFLFSAVTMADIHQAYDAVRDLPYRMEAFSGTELDYRSPAVSPGFYEYFVSTPGHLVPRASFSGELIDRLPDWLKTLHGGQTLWQWAALMLTVPAVVSIVTVLVGVTRRLARRIGAPADGFVRMLAPIAGALLVSVGVEFLSGSVHLTGDVLTAVTIIGDALVVAFVVWAVFGLSRAIAESVIASPRTRIKEDSIDATMWRIGSRILGFLLSVAVLIHGLQVLGADVVPLLAGLGVGGLAVALAAQETLTDIFGALMILADRPYRIGHWVVIGEYEGTVQSIGIRSTRIRTFYDSVLTIPNSKAVTSVVDNMGMREYRRIKTNIGIRYDTPPERVEAFLEGIKRIIQTNPTTRKDYFHVVLNDFGPDYLRILLYCFVEVPDWSAELVERQRILLEIIRLAAALDVQFAFPTQTLEIETFPGQPEPPPPAAGSPDELRAVAAGFGSAEKAARPRGLGIFVPPHEEGHKLS